ncbi:alginate O-acetyltransferase AlgI, partial [human gut metagenome]
GLLLILEKFVLKKFLDRLPSFVQHIYTLFIIIIGWGLFYFTDVGQLGEFMVDLFNFGNGICGDQAFNLIMSNMPMLIIAAVASTPLATML